MAGSRLEKIGTIFSRCAGLLRSGAVRYQDRPVWYDIYRVFPPKYEPYVERNPKAQVEDIPDIFYKDDYVRAQFHKHFGANPAGRPRKLNDNDPNYEDPSQEFLTKYLQIEKENPYWSSEKIFESAAESFHYQPLSVKRSASGDDGETRARRGRKLSQWEFDRGEGGDRESLESELQLLNESEEQDHERRSRKMPLITADSLRALFEEAQSKQSQSGSGGSGSPSSSESAKPESKESSEKKDS